MKPDRKTHYMSKTKLFLLIQSLLCIMLVLLLILAALDIYREGAANKAEHPLDRIYSLEKVAARLGPIAPLFFSSVALTAAGLILDIRDPNRDKPVWDAEYARDVLRSRIVEPNEAMKKEQSKQRRLLVIGWLAFAVCMAPIFAYLCSERHFQTEDPEAMIRSLIAVLIPWTALGFGCLSVSFVLRERSIRREYETARARLKEEKLGGIHAERRPKAGVFDHKHGLVRTVMLLATLLLILAGVWNGGARDVLYKAAKICTECVGLG